MVTNVAFARTGVLSHERVTSRWPKGMAPRHLFSASRFLRLFTTSAISGNPVARLGLTDPCSSAAARTYSDSPHQSRLPASVFLLGSTHLHSLEKPLLPGRLPAQYARTAVKEAVPTRSIRRILAADRSGKEKHCSGTEYVLSACIHHVHTSGLTQTRSILSARN